MRRGTRSHWGRNVDVEVVARFYHSLWLLDSQKYAAIIERGASYVARLQRADGGFDSGWYFGDIYGLILCAQLFCVVPAAQAVRPARDSALEFLRRAQREDGGFGYWQSTPIETAAAITAFAMLGAPERTIVARASRWLVQHQSDDGWFGASLWIRIDIGRPEGCIIRRITHQSGLVTTAHCLRALRLAGSLLAT